MRLRTVRNGVALAAVIVVAGCDAKPPPLAPVRGRVELFGTPLRNGIVAFTPDAERGCYGAGAVGTIGPDGQYALMTDGAPGAAPGWHRVTVASLDVPAGYRIPARYQDPQLSGLRAEVLVGKDNVFDFRLEAP